MCTAGGENFLIMLRNYPASPIFTTLWLNILGAPKCLAFETGADSLPDHAYR